MRFTPLTRRMPAASAGAQESGVGRLVGDTADRGQPQIDCGGRVLALFQVDPIPEDDRAVERQARF